MAEPAVMTKGQRTRRRLLDAARTVFERDGFLQARIVDIASEADMAVGSFYTYFDSKEAVFKELVSEMVGELFPTGNERPDGADPVARIVAANRHFIAFYRRNARLMTLYESVSTYLPEFLEMRLATRKLSVERNRRAIAEMQRQGIVDADLDPFVTANLLVAMASNFTYTWFVLGEEFEPDIALHHLNLLWTRALGLDHHFDEPQAPAGCAGSRGGPRPRGRRRRDAEA